MSNTLILASQSPRRKELLQQLGYDFTCAPADIDESVQSLENPEQYVARLALEKAQAIRGSYSAVVGLPLYETAQLLSTFGVKSSMTTD